uniref:biotinidase-like n=1 Tax=Oncorhynchus gorbuscha TaxID=8017 RepID=UPI001EAF54F0|nr:biotinidase-like [Oncorhynchus gorbuscha]
MCNHISPGPPHLASSPAGLSEGGAETLSLTLFQGAQIIVFPEDGIHGFNFSRLSISGYLETIPDPLTEDWNPCTQPDRHNHTEVLQSLSCMARHHQLYLVANMPDLQPCPLTSHPHLDPSQTPCPPDGRWQFNTDVVFRLVVNGLFLTTGSLAARYHKQNLFFEKEFDTPPRLEVVTFDTPFAGRFGVFTCFDILFHDPTVRLLEKGIRQMIFPTAWMNLLPLLTAVQIQRGVSLGANVTLLAANLRHDSKAMTGSGIFTPSTSLYHHAFHHPGEPEGKLLVLRIPVLDSDWLMVNLPMPQFLPSLPLPPPFNSFMVGDLFFFALLLDSEGQLTLCDGLLCCHLQYQRSTQGGNTELYALGVFCWQSHVCALVQCSGSEVSSCGKGVEEAESRLDYRLEGKFGTRYVYPSLLGSGMVVDGPDRIEKTTDGRVTMEHSGMSVGLVTACLYGRVYDQD